jgi:hypothetical protein
MVTPRNTVPPSLDSALSPGAYRIGSAVTESLYEEFPELTERYGPRGRAYSEHDITYLVSWALEAAAFGKPDMFHRNCRWLADVMESRAFPMAIFDRAVALVRAAVVEQGLIDEEQAALIFDLQGS